jgi:hypothetical protein
LTFVTERAPLDSLEYQSTYRAQHPKGRRARATTILQPPPSLGEPTRRTRACPKRRDPVTRRVTCVCTGRRAQERTHGAPFALLNLWGSWPIDLTGHDLAAIPERPAKPRGQHPAQVDHENPHPTPTAVVSPLAAVISPAP